MRHYDDKLNQRIREICEQNPTSYHNVIQSTKNKDILNYIESLTDDLPLERLAQKINFVLNKFQHLPKCHTQGCENLCEGTKTLKWNQKWTEHCCNKCAQKDKEIQKRIRKTKLKRYGSETYNGNTEALKQHNLEKYGTQYYFQSEEAKKKLRESYLKNGYTHPMRSEKIKEKMKERYREKHGVDHPFQNIEVIRKSRSLYFYGDKNFKSSWELAYYIFLKDNDTQFEYQPNVSFPYTDEKGKERRYFPDFKVGEKYIEVKGSHFYTAEGKFRNPYDKTHKTDSRYDLKRQCLEKNGVKVVSMEEMKNILKHCQKKFGKNKWNLQFKVNNIDQRKYKQL